MIQQLTTQKVGFIIPYIGEWPRWSQLFFESCRFNHMIAVLILCESPPLFAMPENIKVVRMSRDEMVGRFKKVTGLALTKITGHKLCDFRAFYGLAFADLLQDYTFWGYCDVDMMFGDLGKLLHEQFLQSTDVFSAHSHQIVGHFTILRNVEAVNHLGFKIQSWANLLMDPLNRALDEIPFFDVLKKETSLRLQQPNILAEELTTSFARFGITYSFFGRIAYLNVNDVRMAQWENGRVYCCSADGIKTEVLYVHFMGTKHWWHWLFWKKSSPHASQHFFSRIGYGGAKSTATLWHFPWCEFYFLQCQMLRFKNGSGSFLRKILSRKMFLKVRKNLLGKGRY